VTRARGALGLGGVGINGLVTPIQERSRGRRRRLRNPRAGRGGGRDDDVLREEDTMSARWVAKGATLQRRASRRRGGEWRGEARGEGGGKGMTVTSLLFLLEAARRQVEVFAREAPRVVENLSSRGWCGKQRRLKQLSRHRDHLCRS
jgi:hypothetical protein